MQSPPPQVCGTCALSSQKKEVGRVCSSQPEGFDWYVCGASRPTWNSYICWW